MARALTFSLLIRPYFPSFSSHRPLSLKRHFALSIACPTRSSCLTTYLPRRPSHSLLRICACPITSPVLALASPVQLVHARARRRFQRGLKRRPMGLIKKLRNAKKEAGPNEKPAMVKTHLRDMIIVPEMIGSVVGVYVSRVLLLVSCVLV